jgi:hypothetical protein
MGHDADVCQSAPHDDWGSYDGGDSEVKTTRPAIGALRRSWRGIKTRSATSSEGAACRLVTTRRPPAGLNLEPARLEAAGGVPRNLSSKPATSRPGKESWDFYGNEQDFGEEKNPPKPMLTHETSPVSGASVVGITYGACQDQSYLPAGVPGVSTMLG